MSDFESIGIGFGGDVGCQKLAHLASFAEKLKFDSLWVQEDDDRSTLQLSASALNATQRIVVGTAITSPFRRHPHTLAVETATLNEMSNNRFILGLGAAERLIKSFSLNGTPNEAMRDAFAIIRGMYASDKFTHDGQVFSLITPQPRLKPNPRIFLGAIGPRMLELVGELSDGLLITRRGAFSSRYTKYAISKVTEKAKLTGRNPSELSFLGFFETSISKDENEAKRFAKKILGTYTIPRTPEFVLSLAGISEDAVEKVRGNYLRGDIQTAVNYVTDELVDQFALAGTPDQCLEKLHKFAETGLKCPVLYIHGPDYEEAAELAAEKIIPNLVER